VEFWQRFFLLLFWVLLAECTGFFFAVPAGCFVQA
jgi:hypothetical protein